jgi:hypothetical protein
MIRPDRRAWSDVDMPVRFRRLRSGRRLLTIAILVVTVGAVALAATAQPERSALIAGTVGLLIAGANLLVDVVTAMREPASPTEPAELADELARAVGEQWRAEAARSLIRAAVTRMRSDVCRWARGVLAGHAPLRERGGGDRATAARSG